MTTFPSSILCPNMYTIYLWPCRCLIVQFYSLTNHLSDINHYHCLADFSKTTDLIELLTDDTNVLCWFADGFIDGCIDWWLSGFTHRTFVTKFCACVLPTVKSTRHQARSDLRWFNQGKHIWPTSIGILMIYANKKTCDSSYFSQHKIEIQMI